MKNKKILLSLILVLSLFSLGACKSKDKEKTKESTSESSIVNKKDKKNKKKDTIESSTFESSSSEIPFIEDDDDEHSHGHDDHHGFTEGNFPDPSTLENPDGEPADYKEPTHENYKGGRSPEDAKKHEKEDKEKLENMQEWIDEQQ